MILAPKRQSIVRNVGVLVSRIVDSRVGEMREKSLSGVNRTISERLFAG